eukprot:1133005-Rhodomonas_salina.4
MLEMRRLGTKPYSSRQVETDRSISSDMARHMVVASRPGSSRGHVCRRTRRGHPSSATLLLCSWPLFCVFVLPSLPVTVSFVVDCGLGKAPLGNAVNAFPTCRSRSTSPVALHSNKLHDTILGWKRSSILRRPAGHSASRAMCAVSASAEPDTEQEGAAQKKVNLKGLKQETERQIFRQ